MIETPALPHAEALVDLVAASPDLMHALRLVRSLGLTSWCIGAGAIRSLVWDALHGSASPLAGQDVDVVHFDPALPPASDAELARRLHLARPDLCWEVTNQATVHTWFAAAHGQTVPPLRSLEEGVATWPEFATCVGVYLRDDGTIGIVAPHGLDDLFELRVRHNPARASLATYRERVRSKRFLARWPKLSIDDA